MTWLASLVTVSALLPLFPPDISGVEQMALGKPYRTAQEDVRNFLAQPRAIAPNGAPRKMKPESMGVVTEAPQAIVMDRASGAVLYEKRADARRSIGSLTKLMTAWVFLQTHPDLEATAQVTPADVRLGGIQHLSIGDPLRARDILQASLVGSDNSATAALVRLAGLSSNAFVARMNEQAASWGMADTTFVDAAGLSQANRSTARDVARMLDRILQDATIASITREPLVRLQGARRAYAVENTNELLLGFLHQPPYHIVGGKTGFLPEAGYSLGMVTKKDAQGDLLVVALGAQTLHGRFNDVKALAFWAYETYDWP